MKVKLEVPQERYAELQAALASHGIQVDEDAELILSERGRYPDTLLVREANTGARVVLPTREIVSIESFGRDVVAYTASGAVYQAQDRLYRLTARLDPEAFLRISHSVVIARSKVVRIAPTLSMKFILTLRDGRTVDVTRSYYYIFKETFGI